MKAHSTHAKAGNNDVFTYRRIRKAIGILGISLPVVLICLSYIDFFDTRLQSSISHYYYSNLRELFTGTLCAVGLFLIRYKGHGNRSFWKNDNLLTNIAGVMAFGVALIPTNPDFIWQKKYTLVPSAAEWLGYLHYGFAAGLFGCFCLLAINVFPLGQAKNEHIRVSWVNENRLYRICGFAILLCIVLIPLSAFFKWFKYSTLVWEAVSLFFFGFAWLIKGRALGEKGRIGRWLYREDHAKVPEKQDAELVNA
jgi:hypothetical protein